MFKLASMKVLLKLLPERQSMMAFTEQNYPEVNPLSLYTHVCLRRAGGALADAVENFLSQYDISSGRFLALLLLEFREEGVKPTELAMSLGITQATMTGLIKGLQDTGYVKRMEHSSDGRSCMIVLTEKGRKFMSRARPEFNQWIGKVYDELGTENQEQLIGLLEKVLVLLQKNGGS